MRTKKELEEAGHDFTAKLGDPRQRKEMLTEEEEKKVDDKGNLVVYGATWSSVPTGIFLSVYATPPVSNPARVTNCSKWFRATRRTKNARFIIATSFGRPAWDQEGVGCCLELPGDLGQDTLKQQYVVEWLMHTMVECCELTQTDPEWLVSEAAKTLAATAEELIKKTGL